MGYFEKSIEADASHLMNLFGKEDEHIRKIEDDLAVTIVNRGDEIKISGEEIFNCSKKSSELQLFKTNSAFGIYPM